MANTYLPNSQANYGIVALLAIGTGGTTPVAGTGWYLGLNTTSGGQTGANEVTGGSYARQSITFSTSSGVATSTNAQNFTSMPSTTIDYFSGWTASTSGTYGWGGQLSSSLTVPSGATVAFAIGAVVIEVQG